MIEKNIVFLPENNQWISGYITATKTDDAMIHYGFFKTREEATSWAINLINAQVIPVYHPVFNQG